VGFNRLSGCASNLKTSYCLGKALRLIHQMTYQAGLMASNSVVAVAAFEAWP
jgi:hypothetical protein